MRANPRGLLCEKTFGRISPKSSSRNVTSTVLNRNSKRVKRKSSFIMFEVSMTMQMFTRLLVTRIVASRPSTSDSMRSMARSRESSCSLISCKSRGVSEKNATSDPDTRAEIVSSTTVTASSTAACRPKPKYIMPEPSKYRYSKL